MPESSVHPSPADPAEIAVSPPYPSYRRWVHGLSILLVLATFVLIAIGGHVTSHEAGMAVPEAFFTGPYWSLIAPLEVWWYDFGRRLEHSHRLKGYLVGSITIALMISLLWTQGPRRWVKILGIGLLVFVIAQGILGILRVALHEQSWVTGLSFAAVHGVTGQMFFCLTVLAAAATGKFWMTRPTTAPAKTSDPSQAAGRHRKTLRVLPLLLIVALLGQLALGSAVRHSKSALAIPDWPTHYGQLMPPMSQADIDAAVAAIPDDQRPENFAPLRRDAEGNLLPEAYAAWQVHLHFTHRLGAYLIFVAGLVYIAWLWRAYPGQGKILWPATLFAGLLLTQVLLGIMTVVTGEHPTLATSHQSVGAILIGTATWLAIRLHLVPAASSRPAHVPVAAGDATTEAFHQTPAKSDEADAFNQALSDAAASTSKPAKPKPETVNA